MKKHLTILALIFMMMNPAWAQPEALLTAFEKSGGLQTPRYDATLEYCKMLDKSSPLVTLTGFGISPQGRELPLLILDRDGLTNPVSIRAAGRIMVLIQACIHPGESDGKDAGLMLLRDLAFPGTENEKPLPPRDLLDQISILFIPIFNVDGHERFGPYNRINQNGPKEMGWRTTATNLNLNRDFLKADAPEMIAWLNLYNQWLPEFFIDIHATDGADYQYVLTYLMEVYGGMDPGLTKWSNDVFLSRMTTGMKNRGLPVFPYVGFRNWHDPRSGLITEPAPPMLSQGYTSLRNRPGLLIETHMLKPYRQRVEATYECLLISLDILSREAGILKSLVDYADRYVSSPDFLNQPFPLSFETSMKDSVMVEFLGVEYEVRPSEICNGNWFDYSNKPAVFQLPWFSVSRPEVTAQLPYAYIVPAEWQTVIDRIRAHGIRTTELKTGMTIPVSSYKFNNPKWQPNSFEGRHPMTNIAFDNIQESRYFPPGSVIIEVMQPAGRLVPHMLEPKGDGSFLYWGFFDAIFEQKEYAESYVIEKMAVKMLQENPDLKREFEKKKSEDPEFVKNQREVTNWFYNRTPYADQRRFVYPVGKITNEKLLKALTGQ